MLKSEFFEGGGAKFRMGVVAFWVTNPYRITRKVKQTKMYVCTLEEFILVDLDTLLCKLELICIGNAVVYIQSQQWMRNVRLTLRCTIDTGD